MAKAKANSGLRASMLRGGVGFHNQICKARDKMRSLKSKDQNKAAEDLSPEKE